MAKKSQERKSMEKIARGMIEGKIGPKDSDKPFYPGQEITLYVPSKQGGTEKVEFTIPEDY